MASHGISLRCGVCSDGDLALQDRRDSLTTDTDGMLKAQLQFIEKHYGSPGCGMRARRVALSHIYRQRAEAFGIRREMWGAVKSSLRALALYPLDISNARTAGSLLLRYAGIYR